MKTRIVILWCIIAALLSSCSVALPATSADSLATSTDSAAKSDLYTICNRDGKTYMEFSSDAHSVTLPNGDGYYSSQPIQGMQFASISEMRRRISTGDLPEEMISALYAKAKDNALEICDINNLYDLALPENLTCESVAWYFNSYSFPLALKTSAGTGKSIMATMWSDMNAWSYNARFEDEFVNFVPDGASVLSDTVVEDRNARVVYYNNSPYAAFKNILYTITTSRGGTLHVREQYLLENFAAYTGDTKPSETVPYKLFLFGTEGDKNFYGYILHLEDVMNERPSVEWLASFGVVPFAA